MEKEINENKKKVVKKKVKMKNKLVILIPIIIILLIGLGIALYFIFQNMERSTLKSIKRSYSKSIEIKKNAKIYNKDKKVVGSIGKGFKLELEEVKNITLKNAYFKIKDSSYYVSYKDIKKIKKIDEEIDNSYYIPFNKNITGKNVDFYLNNKKVLSINDNIDLAILSMEKDSYDVLYFNKKLSVKKNKNIKEIDHNNSEEAEANHVSVLYYEVIAPTCSDVNCIPSATVRDNIAKLKENGYYAINKEDYLKYLNGYVRLKDKAILVSTKEVNDEVKAISDEYKIDFQVFGEADGIVFSSTNKKSTKDDDKQSVNRYQLKRYTTTLNVLKMANGEDVVESEPVVSSSKAGVPVLNYHFFYDPNGGEACNESICLTVQKFREHLEYLKNNGFTALTMKEFVKWIYGEIDVPEKSVLITIDDGAMGTGTHNGNKLIPLLEEYKMHATLFLIAGWWKIDNYKSDYLEIQSHTYNMHQYGSCGKGELVCANYEEAKKDLETSLIEIKDNTSFCYPFYSYDDEAIQAIKDLGFKVAFAGGNRNATRSSNKYIVPRYPILSDITLNQFINIVN